jgi:hypothetical protein
MTDIIRLGRPFLVLLALALLGRWVMGARGVPYERGHHVFSITAVTVMAAIFYAMFCRRWRGYRAVDAMAMGAAFGLAAQMAIFASTAASYGLGLQTYFTHPAALNAAAAVPFEQALASRAVGLLVGPVIDAVVALVGWLLGGLLPPAIVPHTLDTAP